jgi:hypothetical protein
VRCADTHADRSGTVTIRLLKTSPTNSLLSAMMEFQRSSAASHGQNTITIADKLRGDVITARQCAFQRTPGLNYGKDAGIVEWSFASVNITATLGGAANTMASIEFLYVGTNSVQVSPPMVWM